MQVESSLSLLYLELCVRIQEYNFHFIHLYKKIHQFSLNKTLNVGFRNYLRELYNLHFNSMKKELSIQRLCLMMSNLKEFDRYIDALSLFLKNLYFIKLLKIYYFMVDDK